MKACKFYLTYLCNSRCVYCNIWENEDHSVLSLNECKKRLDELKELGVTYVDFTGGEPMLHKDFIEITRYAKGLGMIVEFTTNGFAFDKYLEDAINYIDYLNISLDTLNRENYKNIRGIDGLENAKNIAIKLGKLSKKAKIICVVTENNRDEIPNLLEFAQKNHIQIYFSPLFSYFEDIKNDCKYDSVCLENLFFEPYTMIPLDFIEFLKTVDPESNAICMCNKDVITISPTGKIMSPCYYHKVEELGTDYQALTDIVNSADFIKHKNLAGTLDACKGCTIIPYLGFSFEYRLSNISMLNIFSENYKKIKVEFLNEANDNINFDIDSLNYHCSILTQLVSTLHNDNSNKYLLYNGEKNKGLIYNSIFRSPITTIKYFYDNLGESIWTLNSLPFNFLENICNKFLCDLKYKALFSNEFQKQYYYELLEKFPLFYTSWWIFYISKIYNVDSSTIDISEYEKIIQNYLNLLKRRIKKFDYLSYDFSNYYSQFEIMRKHMKSYVTFNITTKNSHKNLSNDYISSLIEKLKKDKSYIIKFVSNIDNYSIESINCIIEKIKNDFSIDEINQIKHYINKFRYKDDYFI